MSPDGGVGIGSIRVPARAETGAAKIITRITMMPIALRAVVMRLRVFILASPISIK